MPQSPRVLLVTGLTHWGRGGVQRETETLARSLLARGVPVALASDREVPGVPHFPLAYPPNPNTPDQIWDAIREYRPHVLHATGGGVAFLHKVADAATVPLILTVHCVPPFERTSRLAFGRNRLYRALRDAAGLPSRLAWSRFLSAGRYDRVIVHSAVIASQVTSCGGDPSRLVEISLGSEPPPDTTAASVFADASPRLLTVAGFAHQKGVHDALRAIEPLVREHPRLRYVVMGERREPKYLAWLQRLADSLGLSRCVQFLPDAPEDTKHAAMRECDLYLQPSHEEGFCLTFLEAALTARGLVGTSTGAMPAVARGFPEIEIVPAGDVPRLRAAIRAALSRHAASPTADQTPGDPVARRRASLLQRFGWDTHARAHVELYESLAEAPRLTRAA